MKKAMLLALCITLAGLLAVNGTFADDFSKAVSSVFQSVSGLLSPDPTTAPDQFDVELVYPGRGQPPQLFPGGTVALNVAVKNNAAAPAYFRIAFAVQAEALPHLSLGFNKADYAWSEQSPITIDGRAYVMFVGTCQQALTGNTTSPVVLETVSMNEAVTSAQLAGFDDDFLQIQVLAINANDFVVNGEQLSATVALEKALPLSNFNPF